MGLGPLPKLALNPTGLGPRVNATSLGSLHRVAV
jgi:hypothetical protein